MNFNKYFDFFVEVVISLWYFVLSFWEYKFVGCMVDKFGVNVWGYCFFLVGCVFDFLFERMFNFEKILFVVCELFYFKVDVFRIGIYIWMGDLFLLLKFWD